ncbi:Leucine rich repeat N-terminal domain [Musa troglodytarum]|uniref:Leucine rich repeat N-terminal domain n=1 Tax=Musa troglodytarum TaxID=320322 RepID=A0A9E7I9C8_9LILI|nr:Leucine rich repeat N-terminal domain [Musa troglodytarum]
MDPYIRDALLLLSVFFFVSAAAVVADEEEARALLEFKKGISSDPSGRVFGSWNQPGAGSAVCGSWYGVACDAGGGVVAVDLARLGLVGDLKFSTLVPLARLQNLSLAGNALTGRLVPGLGGVSSLRRLDLSSNQFYGPIPGRITELWGLTYLNLSWNNLSKGFPAGIRNLQQLRVLDLRSNGLRGDIGTLLSELRNIDYVDLSSNDFTGNLLVDAENLTGLGNTVKYLNLSNNKLSGGFFSNDAIPVFKNLESLDVSNNQLSGELPSFDSVFSLRVFRAVANKLYGSVPGALLAGTLHLSELDLSGNGFTGNVRDITSTSLKFLNLSSNLLSGLLPSSIGVCISVDFSNNSISGGLSVMQSWEPTLAIIDLSSNSLSGNYPEASQLQNLTSIRLRNNFLVGSLPSTLGNYPELSIIDLSLNRLSGPVPPGLFTSLTLISLNLSGNQFSGSIPLQSSHSTESLVLPSYSHLESLDLSNNLLIGPLPPEIGNMQRLKLLNLRNNTLSGELPSELSKLGTLEILDLSMNHFKGRIPDMPQSGLNVFNVSYNDLSGTIPETLQRFPSTSFYPGNNLLVSPNGMSSGSNSEGGDSHHHMKYSVRIASIVGSIGAVMLILFALMALYVIRSQELCGKSRFRDQATGMEVKLGRFGRRKIFKSSKDTPVTNSMSFSNDHLLTSATRSVSAHKELLTEAVECGYSDQRTESTVNNVLQNHPATCTTGERFSPGSPLGSSPHLIDLGVSEQSVMLDVYSPDRLAGELFFLDNSLIFTAEELSRAPAEVLGRSSHGTSYKATLDSGHILTVKWLRVGLVKIKKEFAKEAKRIGTIKHPNIIPWRAYYWGPREQERLIISDYVNGDSLALYLYESTPRRYSRLSVSQRLKIAIDVARSLYYLHNEKGLAHGSLKPTNILLTGPDLTARLTDYSLHRLMTQGGTAEHILNLGALGYRAPELQSASKPFPSFKADVYAFGVILMELLTRRSAGDIISGQTGAVDLTDWVQMCNREGRGTDCFDRDITGLEESPRVMDELLAVSLRCILPVNERPNIRTVFQDLCAITM